VDTSLPISRDLDRIPQFGEELAPVHKSEAALRLALQRRSTPVKQMSEPGPSTEQLSVLLRAAARVPDHGKLAPWRFITFTGEARSRFGSVLSAAFQEDNPEAIEEMVAFERGRFERAPVVVAVVSRVRENHKIPEWEQILSAGAACQTMLIAAQAMGFAGQWLTEWYAYHPKVKDALGLKSGERIAGFIYLGTATEAPRERARPVPDDLVTAWR